MANPERATVLVRRGAGRLAGDGLVAVPLPCETRGYDLLFDSVPGGSDVLHVRVFGIGAGGARGVLTPRASVRAFLAEGACGA